MSLRHTFSTIGRRASPLLSLPTSTPRATRTLPPLTTHLLRPQQTRANSSSIPGIEPPWQFNDLSIHERKAYERHGPSYKAHLTADILERVEVQEARRAKLAKTLQAEFGDNWYAILREATRLKDVEEEEGAFQLDRDVAAAETRDEKKALKRNFFDGLNATRKERLREHLLRVAETMKR